MSGNRSGKELYEAAKKLIPGGSNLYSKRAELHSGDWPCYFDRARGIRVTDLDGRTYRDFAGSGVGACVLGYRDEDVDTAVLRAIARGSTGPLLCPEEVELAELLTILHPWAGMCRFTRSGGEAMAVAIRIAQAHTGKPNVVFAHESYHGWHVNDPRTGERFLRWVEREGIAAIIVEPSRLREPEEGELQTWRDRAAAVGAVLIFDEISSGFRRNLGGVHLQYGVTPDIAVFSKAIANGYPLGAVVGTEDVMSAATQTFISSTAWSERIGPSAAVATIQKMWANDVFDHTKYIGELVKGTMEWESKKAGVSLEVVGPPQMLHFRFEIPEQQTAFTQLMLQKGFLAGRDFYPTYAHTLEDCEDFAAAVHDVMARVPETPATATEAAVRRTSSDR